MSIERPPPPPHPLLGRRFSLFFFLGDGTLKAPPRFLLGKDVAEVDLFWRLEKGWKLAGL